MLSDGSQLGFFQSLPQFYKLLLITVTEFLFVVGGALVAAFIRLLLSVGVSGEEADELWQRYILLFVVLELFNDVVTFFERVLHDFFKVSSRISGISLQLEEECFANNFEFSVVHLVHVSAVLGD